MPNSIDKKTQGNIRAYNTDILIIKGMAQEWECSMAEVIHRTIALLGKKQYEKDVAETFQIIAASESLKAQVRAEEIDWDVTLKDGLNAPSRRSLGSQS